MTQRTTFFACVLGFLWQTGGYGQHPTPTSSPPTSSLSPASQPSASSAAQQNIYAPNQSWVVYDRSTGRWYQQQLVQVTVPSVRWEAKPIQQTAYVVQPTVSKQTQTQTVYVPQTQTQVVPRWTGWWNPFRQPTLTYSYQPVTTWVAKSVPVETTLVVPQVVAKDQTVHIPQPVPTTETRAQIVQREIAPLQVGMPLGAVAVNNQPLIRFPGTRTVASNVPPPRWIATSMLPTASMTVAPPSSPATSALPASNMPATSANVAVANPVQSNPIAGQATVGPTSNGSNLVLPPPSTTYPAYTAPRGLFAGGLRPISGSPAPFPQVFAPAYQAPLNSPSSGRVAYRDETQSGMAATVLR